MLVGGWLLSNVDLTTTNPAEFYPVLIPLGLGFAFSVGNFSAKLLDTDVGRADPSLFCCFYTLDFTVNRNHFVTALYSINIPGYWILMSFSFWDY